MSNGKKPCFDCNIREECATATGTKRPKCPFDEPITGGGLARMSSDANEYEKTLESKQAIMNEPLLV